MVTTRQIHFPTASKRRRCRLVILAGLAGSSILIWLVTTPLIALADERLAYDPSGRDDEIRSLISQLDDRSFAVREAASFELAKMGAPALRALAMTVFEASPEQAWRTKRAIELIGTHGDEDVFLKSLGILQLLYLDGSNSLDEKFLELQRQWKLEQKKIIIANLKQLGAKVVEPQSNNNRLNAGFPRRGIFNNNVIVEVMPLEKKQAEKRSQVSTSVTRRNGLRQADLDINKATKKIDSILLATL